MLLSPTLASHQKKTAVENNDDFDGPGYESDGDTGRDKNLERTQEDASFGKTPYKTP